MVSGSIPIRARCSGTTACVWVVVAVVYACAVVVPVFFFLYLALPPPGPATRAASVLRYTSHAADGKVLSVVSYLVPVVLVLSSLVALVLTYHCRRFREKTVRINGPAAFSPNASRPPAGPGEMLTDRSPGLPAPGQGRGSSGTGAVPRPPPVCTAARGRHQTATAASPPRTGTTGPSRVAPLSPTTRCWPRCWRWCWSWCSAFASSRTGGRWSGRWCRGGRGCSCGRLTVSCRCCPSF